MWFLGLRVLVFLTILLSIKVTTIVVIVMVVTTQRTFFDVEKRIR